MRKKSLTLGIDIGTTATKAVLLDESLSPVASAKAAHRVEYPRPGFAEQDARVWWRDIRKVLGTLSGTEDLKSVRSMGISSMGPVLLPVSEDGRPLRKAILYGIDSRAAEEVRLLNEALGDGLASSVCTRYSSQSILPKLLWIKNREPEVYGKTRRFLTASGYAVFRLTGNMALDYFTASAGNLLNVGEGSLYEDGLKHADIDPGLLPPLKWSADRAGALAGEAAERLGLPEGIPVSVGTCDAAAEAVVCGCLRPGDATISLGGTTIFDVCGKDLRRTEDIFVCDYLRKGLYIFGGATSSGGILLEWFAEKIMGIRPDALFERMKAASFRPTTALTLPYLNGARTPINNPDAQALITGLSSSTGSDEVYISLLESLAFDLSLIVSRVAESGQEIERIRAAGGGVRNELLLRMIADVLDREIEVLSPDYAAASGAALLARSSLGEESLRDLVDSVPVDKKVAPSSRFQEYFREKKSIFRECYGKNEAVQESLADLKKYG